MIKPGNKTTFRKYLIIAFLICLFLKANSILFGQNATTDRNLIFNNELPLIQDHKHKVTFGINRKNTFIAKYNPINLVFSGLMYSYQKWLSPQISANCYYSPSCSAYSKLLFREFGAVKGLLSTTDRLMRCDRISATTFNKVSIDPTDNKIHEDVNRYKFKTDSQIDKGTVDNQLKPAK